MRPASNITVPAPTGNTHPGASTVPGSPMPLAATVSTDVCIAAKAVDTSAPPASIVVDESLRDAGADFPSMEDRGDVATKAFEAGVRQQRVAMIAVENFIACRR